MSITSMLYNARFNFKSLEANCQRSSCKVHMFVKICTLVFEYREWIKEIGLSCRNEKECWSI